MTTLVDILVLIVVVVAVIFVVRKLRPRLHARRMQEWEKAGLLPHQVDPYAPQQDSPDDKPDDKDR